jgi:hypothetical protein
MMMRPLMEDDVFEIEPQASQPLGSAERWRILRESVPRGPCWACVGGGRVLGIGGFIRLHPGWATAWTILAADIRAHMVGLTRQTRAILQQAQRDMGARGRIDMHVDPGSIPSVRWADMLGFTQEAWLARALPDGGDMAVWIYEGKHRG